MEIISIILLNFPRTFDQLHLLVMKCGIYGIYNRHIPLYPSLSVTKSTLPKTNSSCTFSQYFVVFFIVLNCTLLFVHWDSTLHFTMHYGGDLLSLCISLCNLTTSYCLLLAHMVALFTGRKLQVLSLQLTLPWLDSSNFVLHSFKRTSICCW